MDIADEHFVDESIDWSIPDDRYVSEGRTAGKIDADKEKAGNELKNASENVTSSTAKDYSFTRDLLKLIKESGVNQSVPERILLQKEKTP